MLTLHLIGDLPADTFIFGRVSNAIPSSDAPLYLCIDGASPI
jgi:hypothetical protein